MKKYKLIKSIIIDWTEHNWSTKTKDDWSTQYWIDVDKLWEKFFEEIQESLEWKIFTYYFQGDRYDAEEKLINDWVNSDLAKELRRAFDEIEVKYMIENNKIKFISII